MRSPQQLNARGASKQPNHGHHTKIKVQNDQSINQASLSARTIAVVAACVKKKIKNSIIILHISPSSRISLPSWCHKCFEKSIKHMPNIHNLSADLRYFLGYLKCRLLDTGPTMVSRWVEGMISNETSMNFWKYDIIQRARNCAGRKVMYKLRKRLYFRIVTNPNIWRWGTSFWVCSQVVVSGGKITLPQNLKTHHHLIPLVYVAQHSQWALEKLNPALFRRFASFL